MTRKPLPHQFVNGIAGALHAGLVPGPSLWPGGRKRWHRRFFETARGMIREDNPAGLAVDQDTDHQPVMRSRRRGWCEGIIEQDYGCEKHSSPSLGTLMY